MEISLLISIAGAIIALASGAGALFVYFNTDRKIKKQNVKINQFIIDENLKANIICEIQEKRDNYDRRQLYLRIKNIGKADARNIRIASELLTQKNPDVIMDIKEGTFPYPYLSNEDFFEFPLIGGMNNEHYWIEFIWDDEYGKDRKRRQTINL